MQFLKKTKQYLAEVWGEVQPREGKVSWPTMDEVKGSTVVVVVTVAILGLYLGLIDVTFCYLITWMLGAQGGR